MSLVSNLTSLCNRIGTEFKAIRTLISGSGTGGIGGLTTPVTTSLVAAINSVYSAVSGLVTSVNGNTGAVVLTTTDIAEGTNLYHTTARVNTIIDGRIGTIAAPSATAIASTQDVSTHVSTAISNLVASSPAALDTLNELAAALGNDANFSTTVTTALGLRLRVDAAQGLTAPQQQFGRDNLSVWSKAEIGADADVHDFVADFVAALA